MTYTGPEGREQSTDLESALLENSLKRLPDAEAKRNLASTSVRSEKRTLSWAQEQHNACCHGPKGIASDSTTHEVAIDLLSPTCARSQDLTLNTIEHSAYVRPEQKCCQARNTSHKEAQHKVRQKSTPDAAACLDLFLFRAHETKSQRHPTESFSVFIAESPTWPTSL